MKLDVVNFPEFKFVLLLSEQLLCCCCGGLLARVDLHLPTADLTPESMLTLFACSSAYVAPLSSRPVVAGRTAVQMQLNKPVRIHISAQPA